MSVIVTFAFVVLLLWGLADYDRWRAEHREPGFAVRHGKLATVAINCWSAVKFGVILCAPLYALYLIS